MILTIQIRTEDMPLFPKEITNTEQRDERAEAVYSAIMYAAREARAAYETADNHGPAAPHLVPILDVDGNKCGTLFFSNPIG